MTDGRRARRPSTSTGRPNANEPLAGQPAAGQTAADKPAAGQVVVTVSRSGGFAGVTRQWTADSTSLAAGDARKLVGLVGAVDLQALTAASTTPSHGMPDAFSYDLAVTVGGTTYRAALTDATLGDDVRALIDAVRVVAPPP